MILSLGFWFALMSAGVVFSAISLGPRWLTQIDLSRTYTFRQGELVALHEEVRELERIARTMERQAAATAVAERRPARRKGPSQAIPLDAELRHDARKPVMAGTSLVWSDPWYLPLLQQINHSRRTQVQTALAAAGLFLFAFVFYHEKTGAAALMRLMIRPVQRLLGRYAGLSGGISDDV